MSVCNYSNNFDNKQKKKILNLSDNYLVHLARHYSCNYLALPPLAHFESELTAAEETLNCDSLFHWKFGAKLH